MPDNDTPWEAHYAGDTCLVLEFGQQIDKQLVDQVVSLNTRIAAAQALEQLPGVLETVPTFRSLAVIYDPLTIHPDELVEKIRALSMDGQAESSGSGNRFSIPVHYGGQSGPDLADVANMTSLSVEHVIELHQQTQFTVYMLGFLPGFAFLGDTPEQLHLPRRTEPRVRVPAGSVAIANQLTGVYPWDSPGGWHIIGNCPVPLFNGRQTPPALFKAGDIVRFKAIDSDEYAQWVDTVKQGRFDRDALLTNQSN